MSDENSERKKHTISLIKLVPADYRIWVSSAEATFAIYNCLELVRGDEPDPTPQPDANGVVAAITPALRRQIRSWTTCHSLAREALFKSLNRSELIKVYDLKLASEIWARLCTEYGNICDILYSKAELNFRSLRKEATTSMQDHINEFTRLQVDVDYHRPPGVEKM